MAKGARGIGSSRDRGARADRRLKAMFDTVAETPAPDHLIDLADQLEDAYRRERAGDEPASES